MYWQRTNRADPVAAVLADRHYTRQSVGSRQFVPPGRCVVLLSLAADALWVSSWPYARYVQHAWAGAWMCSLFRNESPILSSELITQAVAVTRLVWGTPPSLGMVTFIDTTKVRKKRDWGRCYRKAGWREAGRTKAGLVVLQLLPADMPSQAVPRGTHASAFRDALCCKVCARFIPRNLRGRTPVYCSDACKHVAYRRRKEM